MVAILLLGLAGCLGVIFLPWAYGIPVVIAASVGMGIAIGVKL